METLERTRVSSQEVEPMLVCFEGFLKFTRQKLIDSGVDFASKEDLLAYKSEFLDSLYGPEVSEETDSQSDQLPDIAPSDIDTGSDDSSEDEMPIVENEPDELLTSPVKSKSRKKAQTRRSRKLFKYAGFASAAVLTGLVSIPVGNAATDMLNSDRASEQEPEQNNDVEIESVELVSVDLEQIAEVTDTSVETPTDTTPVESSTATEAVTEPAPVETVVPPRAATLLESVASGERSLENIPGTPVGSLSIEGVCLEDVQISVTNAVELNDVTAGLGNAEEMRSLSNPLYRVEADETPQQACEISGQSEHAPRWSRHVSGSQRIKSMYTTPAEMVPQADIHPYSALPGTEGVTYIQGHRTSYSAPFMNLDALTPGATASFSDGFNVHNYNFVGFEQVNPNIHINDILAKTVDGKSTLIVSTCDEGDDVRLLAIFTLAS